MWKNCEVCGKKFHVPYPEIWAYQRNHVYYCTWKCLRTLDKEDADQNKKGDESKVKKKFPEGVKKQAVQIALEGGNPLRFLEECGSTDPSGLWYNIKLNLKIRDPETYNQLPGIRKKAETPEQPEPEETTPEPEEIPFSDIEEEPEENITEPLNYDGFSMQAMKSTKTGFRYEFNREYQFFRIEKGSDMIDLDITEWRELLEELPRAARVLGVELL